MGFKGPRNTQSFKDGPTICSGDLLVSIGNCGIIIPDLTHVLLNSPLLDRMLWSQANQKNYPPKLIQVSPDDLTKAVTSYARTSIFHNHLQLMVYATLAAGGMKLQPQKSHLLCQKHAGPRPGHHQLLVTAISSPSSCSDQEEFQICCIISLRFGHISLPQVLQ